jgi:23S rRNA (guanosine2251-2'-O)-methyltransferase
MTAAGHTGADDSVRLVVGMQPVREAIRVHGSHIDKLFVMHGDAPRLARLERFAIDQGLTVSRVSRGELDRLCGGARHQGVAAHAPPLRLHELTELDLGPTSLLVVLDAITDPHNFGATIRSAVAFGASAVVWGAHHAAPLTPATFRASAGAVEHATLCQTPSLRAAVADLSAAGITTVALDAQADTSLHELDLTHPCALIVGAEDRGVSRGVRRVASHAARLAMGTHIDSLNASVAAAVALYEACRQRRVREAPDSPPDQ